MSAFPDREPSSGPKPPDEIEMAVIVSAIEAAWSLPQAEEKALQQGSDEDVSRHSWKFANRWWQGGGAIDRSRPRRPGTFS